MSGAAARREIVRLAARDPAFASRPARFLSRRSGRTPPSFAALCATPRWSVLDPAARRHVGAVALLIAGRSALLREIDGGVLRAYADLVGAAVLEDIWLRAEGGRDPLPRPDGMSGAIDRLLRDAAAPGDRGQDAAGRLARAEAFLKESDAWPGI